MAVKILIRRKFKEGALNQVSSMLIKARTNAMGNKGYISTDTLVDYDDSLSILIISMWQSKEDWDRYEDSDTRKEHEDKYAELFEGSADYRIYKMGI